MAASSTTALDVELKQALLIAANALWPRYNLRGLIYAAMGETNAVGRATSAGPHQPARPRRLAQLRLVPVPAAALACGRNAQLSKPWPSRLCAAARVRAWLARACASAPGAHGSRREGLAAPSNSMPATRTIAVNLAEVLYPRGEAERALFYVRRVNATSTW